MEERRVKIVVAVKRVVDCNVKVRMKSDDTCVDIVNVKMSLGVAQAGRVPEVIDAI
ncbi:Electron transfer flavoprotein subunit alpha-like protein [Burkholderia ubonensis]|nr:electron transfer flavoprotein subunit alpha-like protein [Burkholderia ubonensis]